MSKLEDALQILQALDLPSRQINERTALCLLAIVAIREQDYWVEASIRPIGITPIMEFISKNYNKTYKPNSRENIRDESVTPMVYAGMVLKNADDPSRSKNSSKNAYQVEETTLELIRTFGSEDWGNNLEIYLADRESLRERYAKERDMVQIPIIYEGGKETKISPGQHSLLIKAIVEEFGSRYAPGASLLYVGDTGSKWGGVFNEEKFKELNLAFDKTANMPDVILYYGGKGWLLLIESVTSNGPMNGQRHEELARLFSSSKAPIVYVTAFPTRKAMGAYLTEIAWETEVWCADSPSHLIHFNGDKFLGPYQ